MHGYNAVDLSAAVPRIRRIQPLPSVYSEEEVQQILNAIDTSTVFGKRDYAIISLAAMHGLRRSDICNIQQKNIDFVRKQIRIIQQKTRTPLVIEMLPTVEKALCSYLGAVKLNSVDDSIFLSARAPFNPLPSKSVYNIAKKYFLAAGINTSGKKRGTHSLRMSLATKLISEDVPYTVIQKILGHENPDSTKHYARIDVGKLRLHALDVPMPSGLFAKRLGLSAGGGQ